MNNYSISISIWNLLFRKDKVDIEVWLYSDGFHARVKFNNEDAVLEFVETLLEQGWGFKTLDGVTPYRLLRLQRGARTLAGGLLEDSLNAANGDIYDSGSWVYSEDSWESYVDTACNLLDIVDGPSAGLRFLSNLKKGEVE